MRAPGRILCAAGPFLLGIPLALATVLTWREGSPHLFPNLLFALLAGLVAVVAVWWLSVRTEARHVEELATVEGSFRRLTEQFEPMLEELRDTRDYFEGIVESSADIIVTVSPSGYVYTFNRGAEAVLGYSRDEVIGRNVEMLFSDPGERDDAIERLRHADNVVNYETRLVTKEGGVRDVMLTLSRLKDPAGIPVGTFGIAKDVTEAKRMQRELVAAERFAAIGQAMAGIQHSLKNMLNALKGGSYMVKVGLTKEDRGLLEQGWTIVQDGIESMTTMSRGMLNYIKDWKPEFAEVDLGELVREIEGVFRTSAEDRGVEFLVTLPDTPARVTCDRKLVHSALMDLLSNSIDACLEADYADRAAPEIRLELRPMPECHAFVLSVRDNGCGMTPEVKRNVFTPLFTTKSKWGTGLGLALTARTIQLHGGEIEVESEPNAGAEFRIRLPVAGPAAVPA